MFDDRRGLIVLAAPLAIALAQPARAGLSLDGTFDSDGLASVNFTAQLDSARDIAVQSSDGKLVLVGQARQAAGGGVTFDRVGLTRLNTNGGIDTGFGTSGLVTTQPGTPANYGGADGRNVAIQDDGKIVVVGNYNVNDGSGQKLLVLRYTDAGVLDSTFDGDGIVILSQATNGESVVIDAEGRIVIAGTAQPSAPSRVGMVARLLSSGAVDTDFATNGFFYAEGPNNYGATDFTDVALSGTDIVAGGPGDADLFVVRLDSTGAPDATFSGDGKVAINVSTYESGGFQIPSEDNLQALAVLDGGSIAIAGSSIANSTTKTILGVLTSAGDLDTGFGTNGYAPLTGLSATQIAYDLVVLDDGSLVLAGLVTPIQVDSTGDNASMLAASTGMQSINGLAVQGDGKVVGGGETGLGGFDYEMTALRMSASGAGPSVIVGTSASETLVGTAGVDTIQGLAGDDTLNGLGSADTLEGGPGNDIMYVDTAGEQVVELAGEGTDTVRALISYTLPNHVEHLSLLGAGAIDATGNSLVNTLTGNNANNVLNGKAGADTMIGKAGNDTYYVDNAGDVVTELASEGTDTIRSTITRTLPNHVENLILTGNAASNGTGNTLANKLTGNGAANTLNGRAGNDTLIGGAGPDKFLFNTALNASSNIDKITDFSPVDDTIRLENAIFTALPTTGTLAASKFKLGTAASTTAHRIIYDQATGSVYYDKDGSGTAAKVKFATLTTKPTLTSADFVVQ